MAAVWERPSNNRALTRTAPLRMVYTIARNVAVMYAPRKLGRPFRVDHEAVVRAVDEI